MKTVLDKGHSSEAELANIYLRISPSLLRGSGPSSLLPIGPQLLRGIFEAAINTLYRRFISLTTHRLNAIIWEPSRRNMDCDKTRCAVC